MTTTTTTAAPLAPNTIDPTRDPIWAVKPYSLVFEHGALERQDLVEALRGELLVYGDSDYGRVGERCE